LVPSFLSVCLWTDVLSGRFLIHQQKSRHSLLITSKTMMDFQRRQHAVLLCFLLFSLDHVEAFLISKASLYEPGLFAKKKPKLSMAEKRRRRAKQLAPRKVELPPANLQGQKTTTETPTEKESDEKSPSTPSEMTKAQQLLEAQRQSVAMLTTVKECVQGLNADDIELSLKEKGYWCIDNFLNNPSVLDELQQEGVALLEEGSMVPDVNHLGSGEYVCRLQGGNEQYVISPRIIDCVVSMTKHLPSQLPTLDLDGANCMATMRTFDRKALQASIQLLTDGEQVEELPPRSFGIVASEENDQRRLSMRYYLVPSEWTEACGGGLTFQDTNESIEAVRDRLVLWRSSTAVYREEAWKGSDRLTTASCIELHLLH